MALKVCHPFQTLRKSLRTPVTTAVPTRGSESEILQLIRLELRRLPALPS